MQLQVHSNGYSSECGTHVGVFIFLMKGEYDNSLQSPFSALVTGELLNWMEDWNHIQGAFPLSKEYSVRVIDSP